MRNSLSRAGHRLQMFALLLAWHLLSSATGATAQDPNQWLGTGTFKLQPVSGLFITFNNYDRILTLGQATTIVDTFTATYPKECAAFSYSHCTNQVTIVVQPGFDVPCGPGRAFACTVGSEITVASEYLRSNRQDYDLVTHEAMHVVQYGGVTGNYRDGDACWYWAEGLADVARAAFGLNNTAAGWALVPGDYTAGYQQTAHFLSWVAAAYGSQVIVYLDKWLRDYGCPTDTFWISQTSVGLSHLLTAYNSAVRSAGL